MTAVDVFTWLGRIWACTFLLIAGAVAAAAISGSIRHRREVRTARALGRAMFRQQLVEIANLETAWSLPTYEARQR